MRALQIVAICLISLTVATQQTSATAQQPSAAVAPQPAQTSKDMAWGAVLLLHPGDLVEFRFRDKDKTQQDCLLHSVDEASLVCESDDTSAPLQYETYAHAMLDRVWVFRSVQKSNRSRVVIETGLGALFGFGSGAFYGRSEALIGAATGAALGAAIAVKGNRHQLVMKRIQIYASR